MTVNFIKQEKKPRGLSAVRLFCCGKPTDPLLWQKNLHRPDGANLFRVVAVGMVAAFHFWQQSWVRGGGLDYLLRTGAVWVDGMIMLSAFCLFLPYANNKLQGKGFGDCKGFYRRRAIRIVPSYYVAVLVSAVVAALKYGVNRDFWLDVGSHLLLIPTLVPQGYIYCRTNGALWTVGILILFYLLFPMIGRLFYQHPVVTFGALCLAQVIYSWGWALQQQGDMYRMSFNQLPAFFGVIAVGFAAAQIFVALGNHQQGRFRGLWFLLGMGGMWLVCQLLKTMVQAQDSTRWQLEYRLPLVLCMSIALVGFCLAGPLPFKGILVWLSGISYNFYIWHQWLAVVLKYDLRLPPWQGDTPPNQLGDTQWMICYLILIWAAALVAAVLGTYLVERPAASLLKHKKREIRVKT